MPHNIGFPKAGGLSIQKLHSKSIYSDVVLNLKNLIPGQLTICSVSGCARYDVLSCEDPLMRVSSLGRVTVSTLLDVTVSCDMSLKYYPYDDHLCRVHIESWGYTKDQVRLVRTFVMIK